MHLSGEGSILLVDCSYSDVQLQSPPLVRPYHFQ